MNTLDLWKKLDKFSVDEIMCLLFGIEPGHVKFDNGDPKDWPQGANLVYRMLTDAIKDNKLRVTFDHPANDPFALGFFEEAYYDPTIRWWSGGHLSKDIIIEWLMEKCIPSDFFDVVVEEPNNPFGTQTSNFNSIIGNLPPKLAAAVKVWEHFYYEPSNILPRKSLKQNMMKWLRYNADKLDLLKPNGEPNGEAIEEIAKVANWETKGGAPKQ